MFSAKSFPCYSVNGYPTEQLYCTHFSKNQKKPAQPKIPKLTMPDKKKQKVDVGDTGGSAFDFSEYDITPAPAGTSQPAAERWDFDQVTRLSQTSNEELVSTKKFNIGCVFKALYAARKAGSNFLEHGVSENLFG